MSEDKPLNVPLIVFSVVLVIVGRVHSAATEPTYYTTQEVWWIILLALVFLPIVVVWTQALWNTLVPRITGWREIGFFEAAGIGAFLALVV